jgi:hypothetical protein
VRSLEAKERYQLEALHRQLCCFGQIFFVLIKNLPAKVSRILSKFDSSGWIERNVVNPHSMGSLRRRSAEAMELKKVNLRISPVALALPLKTRASFMRKFTKTAA